MASHKGLELVKYLVNLSVKAKGYDQFLKNVNFISVGNGQCQAELTLAAEHLNSYGSLHGGCSSTLVDSISTFALMSSERGQPGVSIDLHVTFLKSVFAGETIVIDAKTIRAGKSLAFLEVELKNKNNGTIIARGQHTKFIAS